MKRLIPKTKMGFPRHRKSIKTFSRVVDEASNSYGGRHHLDHALPHRLDESRLAIPWRVAPQQSPPPLHQLVRLCNTETFNQSEDRKSKTVRFDFYVRQRIAFRLDFYVRQYASRTCSPLLLVREEGRGTEQRWEGSGLTLLTFDQHYSKAPRR